VSRRRLRLLAAVPLLAVGLAACSSSLAADDVAEGAEDALEPEVGARPDVSCPDDLEAEVGAQTRCTVRLGDDPQEYGVTVTVTSVEDETAHFDVEVDKEPQG
jgi:hypothetical protein